MSTKEPHKDVELNDLPDCFEDWEEEKETLDCSICLEEVMAGVIKNGEIYCTSCFFKSEREAMLDDSPSVDSEPYLYTDKYDGFFGVDQGGEG